MRISSDKHCRIPKLTSTNIPQKKRKPPHHHQNKTITGIILVLTLSRKETTVKRILPTFKLTLPNYIPEVKDHCKRIDVEVVYDARKVNISFTLDKRM